MIDTIGTRSNRDGIGSKIRVVTQSGQEQHAIVSAAGSYLNSNDKRAHFGLGSDATGKNIEITWPSGAVQTLKNVKSNQILT